MKKILNQLMFIVSVMGVVTGCASGPSIAVQEHMFDRQFTNIVDRYDDEEMRRSALAELKAPSRHSALKRDYWLAKEALHKGRLKGDVALVNDVKALVNEEGIHNVALQYQLLAYLQASVNQVPDTDLAVTKVRRQVDNNCAAFDEDVIASFDAQDIKALANHKFALFVSAACHSFLSGEAVETQEAFLAKAVNEAVVYPNLLIDLQPIQNDTGGQAYGRIALQWFLTKTRSSLGINLEQE